VSVDLALGLPSAVHSILVVEDGIYEDVTPLSVYGKRYSQIEIPLEREDGTVICDVSANTDLKFIRRVSSTNRTRLATIYYLHETDLGAAATYDLNGIQCWSYQYEWKISQVISPSSAKNTITKVKFYSGLLHNWA
jgi:uncharacterized protein (DUF1684 family)